MGESVYVKRLLQRYKDAFGQVINLQKSGIFFSFNTLVDTQFSIKEGLEVHHSLNHGKYLGLPSLVGRSKRNAFAFIKKYF